MATIPFFPPDLFESDRQAFKDLLYEVGTDPEQRFILGRRTAELEEELRRSTGAEHVVACSSGTGGLNLAVQALGVGPGDEVIVPAFCCQPVASSVANLGATPVFADVDPHTMVIDPDDVARLIGEHTKAIMPAHVFSIMADMPRINEIAKEHGIPVVEDAAVAEGAVLAGVPSGRWGDLGVFSFFQVKAFGTAGEGGVVLTDDAELADRVRRLRNHGQDGVHRFLHHEIGQNSRFDEIVAAFQLHRHAGFEERLERRARIADYYTERFAPLADRGLLAPPAGRDGRCYYVYSLLVRRRGDLRAWLTEQGIGSHVYYPVPLPGQPAFAAYAPEGAEWPGAQYSSDHNLAIPIWPHLTDAQVEYIADAVCDFFN
ncbi:MULTISPECIES: DegT/DnrJ/EryC1/StrS family aminotransferase [Streptomyces]|uniref:DegT/DnrJ/EryC1/StrS family aminotransferase n=1 Tax=Streptomyces TaxID=1883 RepID=UPI00163CD0C3|nr:MULTISPECIES: DegT/DnrJ/EryC1/StrS family aminotransferase [Streptomyces]MBC2878811.1 DegT/DnrJ/EryC1/StrS family aminotransferase [Streptomyces sp. TYQ1024]UBI39273.1 DegT/DnrJ/EryC1/StrS family aminotransferase [Streptomyces mobaraensis]UKW31854.1 DegT/DnrJ/EryC1/StrS family aminotransferase [Streptomyces sp. TYQ1024]